MLLGGRAPHACQSEKRSVAPPLLSEYSFLVSIMRLITFFHPKQRRFPCGTHSRFWFSCLLLASCRAASAVACTTWCVARITAGSWRFRKWTATTSTTPCRRTTAVVTRGLSCVDTGTTGPVTATTDMYPTIVVVIVRCIAAPLVAITVPLSIVEVVVAITVLLSIAEVVVAIGEAATVGRCA